MVAVAGSAFCVLGWGTGVANEVAGVGAFVLAAVAAVPALANWARSKPRSGPKSDSAVHTGHWNAADEERFLRGAESGDIWSMNFLGVLYKARGDSARAQKWMRRAAEGGHVGAALNLSRLLA